MIFGLSLGATGVAQNLLVAENVPRPMQTRALSGLHSIYGLSSLVAPFLASRLPGWFSQHDRTFDFLTRWQSAFFVTGFGALAVLVLILVSRPAEAFHHHVDIKSAPTKPSTIKMQMWFAGFFATYVGAEILVSTRLALYMRTYFSMDLEQSSNYVSYFFLFLLLGRGLFIIRSFALPLKTQMNLSLASSLVSLVLGLWLHPFFLTLIGLTMGPFYPLAIVYISEKAGNEARRYVTFAMGVQGLCVISMHIGVGYLTDAVGLSMALNAGIVLLVGSLLCLNLHPEIKS